MSADVTSVHHVYHSMVHSAPTASTKQIKIGVMGTSKILDDLDRLWTLRSEKLTKRSDYEFRSKPEPGSLCAFINVKNNRGEERPIYCFSISLNLENMDDAHATVTFTDLSYGMQRREEFLSIIDKVYADLQKEQQTKTLSRR